MDPVLTICTLCGGQMETRCSPGLTAHCKECWWAIKRLVAKYRETGVEVGLRAQYNRALKVLQKEWYS